MWCRTMTSCFYEMINTNHVIGHRELCYVVTGTSQQIRWWKYCFSTPLIPNYTIRSLRVQFATIQSHRYESKLPKRDLNKATKIVELIYVYEIIYQLNAIEYLFVVFQLDMFRAYTPIFRSNGCYNFFTQAAYGVLWAGFNYSFIYSFSLNLLTGHHMLHR